MLVVVKRKLGQSGSSANTSGGFAAASPDLDPADDPWQHYADTVIGGGFVNERPWRAPWPRRRRRGFAS